MKEAKTRPPCTCGKPSRVLVAENEESVWLCNDCAEPPALEAITPNTDHPTFTDIADAFDYCREKDEVVKAFVDGKLYTLYPEGHFTYGLQEPSASRLRELELALTKMDSAFSTNPITGDRTVQAILQTLLNKSP